MSTLRSLVYFKDIGNLEDLERFFYATVRIMKYISVIQNNY